TGSAGLATLVRGSSRRIKIMRFRPANIRLINRRSNLPRLLLALSSKGNKNNDNDKSNPTGSQELTGSLHISCLETRPKPSLIHQPLSGQIYIVNCRGQRKREDSVKQNLARHPHPLVGVHLG